jgi:hypothetical protein
MLAIETNQQCGGSAARCLLLKYLVCVLSLLALSVLLAGNSYAQVLYGGITGTVTDASGAVIPGAQVAALETQTGVRQTTTTNSEGIYRFTALLPGTYTVTVSGKGFETQTTPDVGVQVNGIAQLNAQLKGGRRRRL